MRFSFGRRTAAVAIFAVPASATPTVSMAEHPTGPTLGRVTAATVISFGASAFSLVARTVGAAIHAVAAINFVAVPAGVPGTALAVGFERMARGLGDRRADPSLPVTAATVVVVVSFRAFESTATRGVASPSAMARELAP